MLIFYLAGRYRHFLADGQPDTFRMELELLDELQWGRMVWESGCVPILPLTSTVPIEALGCEGDWLRGDLSIITALHSEPNGIIMRPGWDVITSSGDRPEWYIPNLHYHASEGSAQEYEQAMYQELRVLHGCCGIEAVSEQLKEWTREIPFEE